MIERQSAPAAGRSLAGKEPSVSDGTRDRLSPGKKTFRKILIGCLALWLIAGFLPAQNPPLTGNPYAPRGSAKSPDGNYEWIVKTNPIIQYQLLALTSGKVIATVNCYYPNNDEIGIRYAKAVGIYWNRDSSLVALDELNRRRAGHLYLFIVNSGKVVQQKTDLFLPVLTTIDEARLVVDPGWISGFKIRVRLVRKATGHDSADRFYLIDLANPGSPQIVPAADIDS